MIRYAYILGAAGVLVAVVPAGSVRAQDTAEVRSADSARVMVLDPGLSLGKPLLLLPPALREERIFVVPPLIDRPASGLAGLPFVLPGGPQAPDLMAAYRIRREREQELSTLRSVLGTVQLGAVGYVAYLHFKKRGVLR